MLFIYLNICHKASHYKINLGLRYRCFKVICIDWVRGLEGEESQGGPKPSGYLQVLAVGSANGLLEAGSRVHRPHIVVE